MTIEQKSQAVENIKANLTEASNEAKAIMKNKFNNMREEGKEAVQAMEENLYEIGAKTKDVVNTAEEELKYYTNSLESKIKKNPLLSTTIAFTAGMILAKLFFNNKQG